MQQQQYSQGVNSSDLTDFFRPRTLWLTRGVQLMKKRQIDKLRVFLFDIKPNLGQKCQKMTGLRRSSSFNVNGDFFLKGGRGLTGLVVCHAHLTNNFFRHCQDQMVGDQIDHRPGQLHCVQEVFAFPQLSNPSENQQKLQKLKIK